MSYFDHVRCSACKAVLDPENLANLPGQGMSCPQCHAPLSLGDLFGLKDSFVGLDEGEGADMSLDDLIPGSPQRRSAYAESASASAPPTRPESSGRPVRPRRPSRPSSATGLVRRGSAPQGKPADDEPPAKGSALEAMRALKKR